MPFSFYADKRKSIRRYCIVLGRFMLFISAPLSALDLSRGGEGLPLDDSLSFFKDISGELDRRQVQRANIDGDFLPLAKGSVPNFGYTHSTVWLHAELTNRTVDREWLLELSFSTLDSVEVYLLEHRGGRLLHHYHTGDKLPFS